MKLLDLQRLSNFTGKKQHSHQHHSCHLSHHATRVLSNLQGQGDLKPLREVLSMQLTANTRLQIETPPASSEVYPFYSEEITFRAALSIMPSNAGSLTPRKSMKPPFFLPPVDSAILRSCSLVGTATMICRHDERRKLLGNPAELDPARPCG